MIFAHLIAGVFAGPFLTRWYVRARCGREAPEVLEAYERSEDRHGSIGRLALRFAGPIALLLVVSSALFSANRYTVLRAHGVDVARRGTFSGRTVLPYASVVSIGKSGKDHVVRFAGGRTLTTKESLLKTGDLAGSGKTPRRAVEIISARSGRPIVEKAF
jgi:hypothetical protein